VEDAELRTMLENYLQIVSTLAPNREDRDVFVELETVQEDVPMEVETPEVNTVVHKKSKRSKAMVLEAIQEDDTVVRKKSKKSHPAEAVQESGDAQMNFKKLPTMILEMLNGTKQTIREELDWALQELNNNKYPSKKNVEELVDPLISLIRFTQDSSVLRSSLRILTLVASLIPVIPYRELIISACRLN
jgi:hypothetical protein